jgi:hypothetical protein
MAKIPTVGRASIFRGKEGGVRVQGIVTKRGGEAFEDARARLAQIAFRDKDSISDADVIEFLARGVRETRQYIRLSSTE